MLTFQGEEYKAHVESPPCVPQKIAGNCDYQHKLQWIKEQKLWVPGFDSGFTVYSVLLYL